MDKKKMAHKIIKSYNPRYIEKPIMGPGPRYPRSPVTIKSAPSGLVNFAKDGEIIENLAGEKMRVKMHGQDMELIPIKSEKK